MSFFFQAEDGIRDYKVTGVQTCALPIFLEQEKSQVDALERLIKTEKEALDIARGVDTRLLSSDLAWAEFRAALLKEGAGTRSEERRVGKECRSRWSPYH